MNFAVLVTAAALLAQQVNAPITGEVVDDRGRPVAGAEVIFTPGEARDGSVAIGANATTDEMGRFRLQLPGLVRPDVAAEGAILAHKTGMGMAIIEMIRADGRKQSYRIALEPAAPRKLTVRGGDGRPLDRASVAPRLVQTEHTGYVGVTVPDRWIARLSTASDDHGVATLTGLARSTKLRAVWIAIPDRGIHIATLPFDGAYGRRGDHLPGRSRRLSGVVQVPAGVPVAGAQVEVWVRCGVPFSEYQASYRIPERVQLDTPAITTDSLGKFQTPSLLCTGSTYRVVVRKAGHTPAVSDWITLNHESSGLPPVVVSPVRTVAGRVLDRQGNPVALVRVFEPAGGPSTITDEAGRFQLEGTRPGRWVLLARRDSFRLQGRLIDSQATGPIELVLCRHDEHPIRVMESLPERIPQAESRALARRVIEPYLREAIAKGDDAAKFRVLDVERWLNPAGLLEQLQKTRFTLGSSADFLRGEAALALLAEDPDEAAAIAETIADPDRRAGTLIDLVDSLPAQEKPRKLTLLERAALQTRTPGLSANKLFQMGEVAERWLELGEKDRALALFAEGRKLAEALPPLKRGDAGSFAYHLARVEPDAAMALARSIVNESQRERVLGNIAIRLALEHPAEAEQALRISWTQSGGCTAPRICRRLAERDPARATADRLRHAQPHRTRLRLDLLRRRSRRHRSQRRIGCAGTGPARDRQHQSGRSIPAV